MTVPRQPKSPRHSRFRHRPPPDHDGQPLAPRTNSGESSTIGARARTARAPTLPPNFEEVLAGVQAKSDSEWVVLYESLAPCVIGYLRAQGVADPEDVSSEVFIGILVGAPSFD
ncbi:MAG: hypothetical protein LC799_21720, partial [Actinobacteria bacterium]|nr:hypothetical protein [Actinomycetota bacterium]